MSTDRAEQNAAAAGSPRPLTLGSMTLLLHPPTVRENGAIALKCARHRKPKTAFSKLLADPAWKDLPQAAQVRAVELATPYQVGSDNGALTDADLMESLADPECLAFCIWVLALKEQRDLKLSQVRKHVTPETADEVLYLFLEASGMLGLGPEGNSDGRPGSTPMGSTPPA